MSLSSLSFPFSVAGLVAGFNIIEGNSDRAILRLVGDDCVAPLDAYIKGKGFDKVCEMIEKGEIEVVNFKSMLYFNLYV